MAPRRIPDGRKLTLEEAHDPFEGDLLGRPVQRVAAAGAAYRADDPARPERRHDLLEDGAGRVGGSCDLVKLSGPPSATASASTALVA